MTESLTGNPWTTFDGYLQSLNITLTQATKYFLIHYENAITIYTDEYILEIFYLVADTNAKKYEKLITAYNAEYNPINNYDMTETSNDTRTPDLTSTSTGSASTNGTSKINQSHTMTEIPNNYTDTITRSVNPYDGSGYRDESKNVSITSGSRTNTETYEGNADETHAESESSGTTTQTGTETFAHTLTRIGNIGVTTSQQMIESEIQLAAKMNIFRTIEKDIAKELFIQVWQ